MLPTAVLSAVALLAVASLPGQQAPSPQAPSATGDLPELPQLLADMRVRAGRVERYRLEMTTAAVLPNGLRLQSRGSLRVLSGTHFQVETEATYSDGLMGSTRSLRTPDGILILEEDPTIGRVFFRVDPELMRRLDRARKVLADNGRPDAPVLGAGPDAGLGPHGHQVLAELASRFDLKVVGRGQQLGESAFRITGSLRGGVEGGLDLPSADRVEAWVRERDRALVKVTQTREGQMVQEIAVTRLQIDPPMDPKEFILRVPGQQPIDVRDFPPAWQQIQRVLQQADSLREGDGDADQPRETGGNDK